MVLPSKHRYDVRQRVTGSPFDLENDAVSQNLELMILPRVGVFIHPEEHPPPV